MTEPNSALSPEKLDAHSDSIIIDDDYDMTFNEPPSSPFVAHIDHEDQENIAPNAAPTPVKPLVDFDDDVPQSAFKVSPEKKSGLKERTSPMKTSPVKNLMEDFEEAAFKTSTSNQSSPMKISPVKSVVSERPEPQSPTKSSRAASVESSQLMPAFEEPAPDSLGSPSKRQSSPRKQSSLRDNEGLTVAMKFMEEPQPESRETLTRQSSRGNDDDMDLGMDTEFNPDGPEITSIDIDDTGFSNFSEMPGLDMTKFASLRQSPVKDNAPDVR
jgi:hypothetical protein